jgi:molybdate transport system substrate-binding protein
LIVPASAEAGTTIEALLDPKKRIVLAAPTVPAGSYAGGVIARLCDILQKPRGVDCPLAKVVSEEPDVKGVVAKVALGEADLGFVYATDAKAAGSKVRTVPIPEDVQPRIRYTIAVVKDAPDRAAARRFVDLVLGPRGRTALRQAGFGLP